jgi:hypothetical protein
MYTAALIVLLSQTLHTAPATVRCHVQPLATSEGATVRVCEVTKGGR